MLQHSVKLSRSSSMKVETSDDGNPFSAHIVFEHLSRGSGQTLGLALRRTLLYAVQGSAITSLQIEGVLHEFSNIPGVKEDIVDIVLNLKKVVIGRSSNVAQVVRITVEGPCELKAGAIEEASGDLHVVNKDQVICTVTDNVRFVVKLTIETGCGYKANVDEEASATGYNGPAAVGVIPIDASFSPIERVTFDVGSSRLGQVTDYDRLHMLVVTNGAISPDKAVSCAAKVLREQLMLALTDADYEASENSEANAKDAQMEQLNLKLEDLELSVRSQNCLRGESIVYLGDLVQYNEAQMLKMPNFGKKSLTELKSWLVAHNLSFGMKVINWTRPVPRVMKVEDDSDSLY